MTRPEATDTLANPSHSMLHRAQVNVRAYGATGDGVTNDTVAVQAAIDAAIAGPNHVFFPKGDYFVSSTLTLGGGIRLSGTSSTNETGQGSRIFGNVAGPIIENPVDLGGPIYSVIIEDLVLGNANASGSVIALANVQGPAGIYRCSINSYNDGVVLGDSTFDIVILGCDVNGVGYNGTGIYTVGHTYIYGCDVTGYDIGIHGYSGLGNAIVGCRLEVCNTGIQLGTDFWSGICSGLYFESCSTAIYADTIRAAQISGVSIHGGTNGPTSPSAPPFGIELGTTYRVSLADIHGGGSYTTAFMRIFGGHVETTLMNIGSGFDWQWDTFDGGVMTINCDDPSATTGGDVIRVPTIATASLPAAAAAQDGRLVIEDTGGDPNLVIYTEGTRRSIPVTAVSVPLSITGLTAWYTFDDIGTLWKDTARTSAVTADGDIIKGVTDLSGGGFHLSEATNGPTYKTSIISSKSVARFDGTNDTLAVTRPADASFTLFVVAQKRSAPGAAVKDLLGLEAAGLGQIATGTTWSATNYVFYADDAAAVQTGTGVATSVNTIVVRHNSTASLDWFSNGGTATNFNPANQIGSGTILELGAAGNDTQWGDYDIGEVILYDSALSNSDLNLIGNYLERWGLTWTDV